MSVFTPLDGNDIAKFLQNYAIGNLENFVGIQSGVVNTNYYVDTTQGKFVLTVFEVLDQTELPYFLALMDHVNEHGVLSQQVISGKNNPKFFYIHNKPAILSVCFPGNTIHYPTIEQCAMGGQLLAELQLALLDFLPKQDNAFGYSWFKKMANKLFERLNPTEQQLLQKSLDIVEQLPWQHLPKGTVHADFFPDNILIDKGKLSGVIDYYFACHECLVYDLAIAINAWCFDKEKTFDESKYQTFLSAYESVKPLNELEHQHLPGMLVAAALRFWLSRLDDCFKQVPSSTIQVKDPNEQKALIAYYLESYGY